MKRMLVMCLGLVLLGLCASPLLAQEHAKPADAANVAKQEGGTPVNAYLALAIGFGLAIAVFGGAISQSKAIASAVEAMARQPEAGGRIFGAMFLGLALIESLVIYMWITTFILMGQFK